MGQLQKLVKKFLSDPPRVRFEEVRRLLESFGFEEVRSSGSHHIFRDAQGQMQVVPKSGGQMVKRTYVRQIVRLLNLEEWHGEQED